MRRKVSKIGPSTLMVSLPSKWVRKLGVKKGDELEVQEEGHLLKVQPACYAAKMAVSLQMTEHTSLRRSLNSLYTSGCDAIEISSDQRLDVVALEKELAQLLGYEIMEHSARSCLIKDVAKSSADDFDAVLRRLFLIALNMSEESMTLLRTCDHDGLKRVASMEQTTNKFTLFCIRLLHKYGYHTPQKVPMLTNLIHELERVADIYRDICLHGSTLKRVDDDTLKPYAKANELLNNLYSMFYKFDESKAHSYSKERRALTDDLRKAITQKSGDHLFIHYLISLLSVFAHLEYLIFYS